MYILMIVAGALSSGLLVDKLGIGPAGKKHITGARILSILLMIIAVGWAVSPQFADGGADNFIHWIPPMLLVYCAGALSSFQHAMNGCSAIAYGNVMASTLVNFVAGFGFLLIAYVIKVLITYHSGTLSDQLWMYMGGPLGIIYVALNAYLVRLLVSMLLYLVEHPVNF